MHSNPAMQKLLEDRYYLRDENGKLLETDPYQMYSRVATDIAEAEKTDKAVWFSKFYELMAENKFLPNTPLLINAGKENPGSYSACFYIPVGDSMEGIFDAVKQAAVISKSGGGVGFNFSSLRPKGAIVKSTGHKASGPVSFMKVFNTMCDTVSQGGVRRGAMIALLSVDHPDIEEFISCKDDGVSFTNFNISVTVTDEFMQAVEDDDGWGLYGPGEQLDPVRSINARELWNKICEHAWKTGEPGLVFIDTMRKDDPEIQGCNPCGEIPLRDYESCNLGSINLLAYVNSRENPSYPDFIRSEYYFDFDTLKKDVPTMVRFLDDVIDVNHFPLPEIEEATKKTRKIGLGVMGWADTLIKLEIPYDSDEAIELASMIVGVISDTADESSYELGIEKGVFPATDVDVADSRRNGTIMCVAPTGTISRIAGVSSGIEPIFAWKTHHKLVDLEYDETHWAYKEFRGNPDNDMYMLPEYMRISSEIDPGWHLQHQAVFQKYVDNSVSKTINLAHEATVEDVEKVFLEAWHLDCKGITVYRDGSRTDQPLNKIDGAKLDCSPGSIMYPSLPLYRTRGPVAIGSTHKVETNNGKMYITINYDREQQEPIEVFIRLGTTATPTEIGLAEWTGRLLSLCLKYNVPIDHLQRQSNKIYGDSSFLYDQRFFSSIPQVVSHLIGIDFDTLLEREGFEDVQSNGVGFIPDFALESFAEDDEEYCLEEEGEYCYNCGTYNMHREGNCMVCTNCNEGKCG